MIGLMKEMKESALGSSAKSVCQRDQTSLDEEREMSSNMAPSSLGFTGCRENLSVRFYNSRPDPISFLCYLLQEPPVVDIVLEGHIFADPSVGQWHVAAVSH